MFPCSTQDEDSSNLPLWHKGLLLIPSSLGDAALHIIGVDIWPAGLLHCSRTSHSVQPGGSELSRRICTLIDG